MLVVARPWVVSLGESGPPKDKDEAFGSFRRKQ